MVAEFDTSDSPTTATASKIATETLPQAIAAATTVNKPEGYTLITIGFKKELNYAFAVANPVSNAQIFEYLPDVLTSPFEEDGIVREEYSNTTVLELVPLKVNKKSYLVTVAKVYFPDTSISLLQALILNSTSLVYNSDVSVEKQLSSYIDPSIPLTGLVDSGSGSMLPSGLSAGSDGSEGSDGSSATNNINLGSLDEYAYGSDNKKNSSDDSNKDSNGMKAKTIGILIGSLVGGISIVFALIILLATHIKNKKKILSDNLSDDQGSYDSYDYASSFDFNPALEKGSIMADDQVSISPSAKINNWIDYNAYSDYSEDVTHQQSAVGSNEKPRSLSKKTSSLKISRPIASENSLGWNDM